MARSSPGVRRVAAILNFLAEHPGQAFSLTDLVRALKLSRATCHALLTGLVEVGYLYRASDKSYVLGPALAAIGRTAAEHASPLQVAQPEMRALADEFQAICSAFFRDGHDVIVRDRAASVAHLGWSMPPGSRQRLNAPLSAIFLAWADPAEAEAWLDSATPTPTPAEKAAAHKRMAFAREHGFTVIVTGRHAGAARPAGPSEDPPRAVLTELNPDEDYALMSVAAPVFDTGARVAFVLGLTGFSRTARGAEIERIGRRLRESCDRVTAFVAGRMPPPQSQAA